MTVTEGEIEETLWPPMVAVMITLPAVVPLKVAEYVPFLWSVLLLNAPWPLPVPRPKTIVSPPADS